MPEPRISLDDACVLLRCSARTLFKTVEFALPELRKSLDAASPKPIGKRSRVSTAQLILKEIADSLDRVSYAMQCLQSAIKREDASPPDETGTSLKIADT
jgi:hypothetical protein